MTTPDERAYALTIIARYTRNGYTQWQNVAQVLGRHIVSVKAEFDLSIPPMPAVVIVPMPPARPEDPTFPRLRAKVLCYLAKGPSQPEHIAASTGMRPEAARARLSELQAQGLVCHNGAWGRATSRTWSLTATGTEQTLNVCPVVTGLRSPSTERKTA